MDKRELAYAKQAVLVVKDWDIFQAIIQNHKNLLRLSVTPPMTGVGRKRYKKEPSWNDIIKSIEQFDKKELVDLLRDVYRLSPDTNDFSIHGFPLKQVKTIYSGTRKLFRIQYTHILKTMNH